MSKFSRDETFRNYIPTEEETIAMKKVLYPFFGTYLASIVKQQKIPLRSMAGAFTIMGSGTFGEIIGRMYATKKAKVRLTELLPKDSPIRAKLLEKMDNLQNGKTSTNEPATFEESEINLNSNSSMKNPSVGNKWNPSTDNPGNSVKEVEDSWSNIRRQNETSWDKLKSSNSQPKTNNLPPRLFEQPTGQISKPVEQFEPDPGYEFKAKNKYGDDI
ncbi:hypothetical protein HK096_008483 [Nowakowskiella sp. JEL0078]|nr:hypothetical protein HK096_008483 [Nowakowskiella sp. JEL0078]